MLRRFRRVCGGIFPLAQIHEAACLLSPGSPCSFSHTVTPFETEEQRAAKLKMLTDLCWSSTAAYQNRYDNLRRNRAMAHGNQYELKMFVLLLEMVEVPRALACWLAERC
eukprot:5712605-Pleurochrysis_carterae.AAC.1